MHITRRFIPILTPTLPIFIVRDIYFYVAENFDPPPRQMNGFLFCRCVPSGAAPAKSRVCKNIFLAAPFEPTPSPSLFRKCPLNGATAAGGAGEGHRRRPITTTFAFSPHYLCGCCRHCSLNYPRNNIMNTFVFCLRQSIGKRKSFSEDYPSLKMWFCSLPILGNINSQNSVRNSIIKWEFFKKNEKFFEIHSKIKYLFFISTSEYFFT